MITKYPRNMDINEAISKKRFFQKWSKIVVFSVMLIITALWDYSRTSIIRNFFYFYKFFITFTMKALASTIQILLLLLSFLDPDRDIGHQFKFLTFYNSNQFIPCFASAIRNFVKLSSTNRNSGTEKLKPLVIGK